MVKKCITWFVMLQCCLVCKAQPLIVSCPLDTSALFEITLVCHQFMDSSGRLQTKIYSGGATPNWFAPDAFIHEQTGEECTPFIIEFENNEIYMYDSTGHYPNIAHPDSANRFLLTKKKIISLKMYIQNETKETVKLNAIPLFKEWHLPIVYLTINYTFDSYESNVKIDAKHWSFLSPDHLFDVKISVPLKESKKKLLKDLAKFKSLEYIQIQNLDLYRPK